MEKIFIFFDTMEKFFFTSINQKDFFFSVLLVQMFHRRLIKG
jgi:hypothetical protein